MTMTMMIDGDCVVDCVVDPAANAAAAAADDDDDEKDKDNDNDGVGYHLPPWILLIPFFQDAVPPAPPFSPL